LRIVLIVVVIILGLVVVLPFILSIAGVRVLQFSSIGGGSGRAGEGILISVDGGDNWAKVNLSEDPKTQPFPKGVFDIAFHPQDENTIFLGSDDSGLWQSINKGKSWRKVFDAAKVLDVKSDVYKVALSPSNPLVIYLAVFQGNRGRVLKSTDGGKSFREIYFASANRYGVFDIYVYPTDPERLLIATGQGGILESLNGGRTWRVIKWFSESLARIIVNPRYPSEMYVVTSSGNLFKTLDGGANWADLPEVLSEVKSVPYPPPGAVNPFNFLSSNRTLEEFIVDPVGFDTAYIGSRSGLLRSVNGGHTWQRLDLLVPPEALPVDAVAVHPEDPVLIFAAASNQLYRSGDGGTNWSVDILPTSSRIKTLLIHPLRPEVMFAILGR